MGREDREAIRVGSLGIFAEDPGSTTRLALRASHREERPSLREGGARGRGGSLKHVPFAPLLAGQFPIERAAHAAVWLDAFHLAHADEACAVDGFG